MWIVIILVRLAVPFIILKRPLAGTLAAMLADAADYTILIHSPIGPHNYQYIDKLLDTYYLTFMCLTVTHWRDVLARRAAIALYGFRVFGVLLFIMTGAEYLLFFFPNVFEYFFLFYVLYSRATHQKIMLHNPWEALSILVSIWIPKLFEEYALHISLLIPIDTPQALSRFFAMPGIYQMPFYAAIPLAMLFWKIRHASIANQKPAESHAARH